MAQASSNRIIAAGAIGNLLEWYDFAIYGYFAAAIGRTFFPSEDKIAQLLAAFGIFAVGFLMRPVGGALFGYIGDRLGRRAALTVSVTAMTIPTFLVGVLPGYHTLGVAAPILLTLLRMIQGLSVGGEYTTSIVFMVEHARPDNRALIGALACLGGGIGVLAGSASGAVLASMMSEAELDSWGWRIPFVLGLVVGLAGFFLRHGLGEHARAGQPERSPLVEALRNHRPVMLRVAALSVFNCVGFYLVFVYVVSWLQLADGMPPARSLDVSTVSMALLLVVMVGAAWLSDRVGRRPMMLGATAFAFVAAWPLLWLMHRADEASVLLGQLGFVLAVGTFIGCQPALMVEAVPVKVRCTAIAVGYNATAAVMGGLTPLAATWLVERTANDLSPAFMIMAAATISFLALLSFRETFRLPLET
jgi:MHS family proline/betaine transporter-like MFS transporter